MKLRELGFYSFSLEASTQAVFEVSPFVGERLESRWRSADRSDLMNPNRRFSFLRCAHSIGRIGSLLDLSAATTAKLSRFNFLRPSGSRDAA